MNNANSPAMPTNFTWVEDHEAHHEMNSGLTKLEHFAGLAMQGLISNFSGELGATSMKNVKSINGVAIIMAADILDQIAKLEGESNE